MRPPRYLAPRLSFVHVDRFQQIAAAPTTDTSLDCSFERERERENLGKITGEALFLFKIRIEIVESRIIERLM